MKQIYETDWLNSSPVFYHEITKKVGHNINDVVDYRNLEFDPEGLCNYLECGYSVLGLTPLRHVRFLRWSSRLTVDEENGIFEIEELPDPAMQYYGEHSSVDEIIDLLHTKINAWMATAPEIVVVPTSGGYDSRLINYMVDDKSRIRAYTYGTSKKQSLSYEVRIAKWICRNLGIQWEQIELGAYNEYINQWIDLYGVSTHAGGMIMMEFLDKIARFLPQNKCKCTAGLISGLIGDAWAGSIFHKSGENNVDLLHKLALTHGVSVQSSHYLRHPDNKHQRLNEYLDTYAPLLENEDYFFVIESMRTKMILLSYLLRVPEHLGFSTYAPFIDIEIACKMLLLPQEYRNNRKWQTDFFRLHHLVPPKSIADILTHIPTGVEQVAMKKFTPPPLDIGLLGELFEKTYIEWINQNYYKDFLIYGDRWEQVGANAIGRALLKASGLSKKFEHGNAFSAYMILRPLEELLKRRT